MTQPAEPTPGAPAAEPTPEPTPQSAPTGQAPAPQPAMKPPWERDGQTFDPERAWKLIESLRAENDKHKTGRSAAEQTATEAQERLAAMLKAAGFNPDGSQVEDPEKFAAQLAERAELAEARLWTLGVKSAVYDQAAAAGANAKLVYSSAEFRDMLDDLVEQDPDKPEVRAAIAQKMAEFVAANPEYAAAGQAPAPAAPRPDPSQGVKGPAAPARPTSLYDAIQRHLAPK